MENELQTNSVLARKLSLFKACFCIFAVWMALNVCLICVILYTFTHFCYACFEEI